MKNKGYAKFEGGGAGALWEMWKWRMFFRHQSTDFKVLKLNADLSVFLHSTLFTRNIWYLCSTKRGYLRQGITHDILSGMQN